MIDCGPDKSRFADAICPALKSIESRYRGDDLPVRHLWMTSGGLLLAEDHPGRAEPIRDHAETFGKEGLFHRHAHRPALGEGVIDTFRLGGRIADLYQLASGHGGASGQAAVR